jgi:hypothetical protein
MFPMNDDLIRNSVGSAISEDFVAATNFGPNQSSTNMAS